MYEKEADSPLLMQTVTDEMKTLFTMLDRLGNIQLSTGVLRRVRQGESIADYAEVPDQASAEDEEEFTEADRRLILLARQEFGIEAG
jgi:hypothetical protein